MVSAGIHIVPLMAAADVVTLALEAERIGYEYCLVADEGFHPDVYACLGAIARETDRISIGAMTNGYTRHPAVTAAAMATIDELSGGRALVTLLAGGSMVLAPMGIPRERPYRIVSETVDVLRRLWSGETVTWSGSAFALDNARLGRGPRSIPLWIASRGPMLLGLAGRGADGVVLTVKPDLGAALELVDTAATSARRDGPQRIYLSRLCYTPAMLADQRLTLPFVLMDSPRRVLRSLGFDDATCALVEEATETARPELLDAVITDDLLRRYQVAGSPAECTEEIGRLEDRHRLDTMLIDVLSSDLDENIELIRDSYPIICPNPG